MQSEKLFEKKKILICCGSGGVGKTTLAASIALEAARSGKKSIVLTIDPAKRLAAAMGISDLTNEPKLVPIEGISGQLFAMMLDTKRTFDRLIEKYTSDPKTRRSIFENRLYQHLSSMIAGSQEYMAMERLYELYKGGEYDLLVLDTPPTRHALDFLEAPKKMVNLTGDSVLHWFLKPGIFVGKASKIFSVFDRLAGFSFLHELAEMLALISSLLSGFKDRAQSVYDLLREDFCGFLLVSSPASISIQDALYFLKSIKEYKLPFSGFIINRIHEPFVKKETHERDLATFSPELRRKVERYIENYEQLALRDQQATNLLRRAGSKKASFSTVPLLTNDVHDLKSLKKMSEALFS